MVNCVNSFVVREIHFRLFLCLELGDLFCDGIVSSVIIFKQFYFSLEGLNLSLILFEQPSDRFYRLFFAYPQPFFEMSMGKLQRI